MILLKTDDSIIGKYNQTYFIIRVDNTQNVELNEKKGFYKNFTNALNIDDNSMLELYRKNKRLSRYLFDYVKYRFSDYVKETNIIEKLHDEMMENYDTEVSKIQSSIKKEKTELSKIAAKIKYENSYYNKKINELTKLLQQFFKEKTKVEKDFNYSLPELNLNAPGNFSENNFIIFSSDELKNKIIYNLIVVLKSKSEKGMEDFINFHKNTVFPNYYIDINDFTSRNNELILSGSTNFDKLL